ncbi:MAG: glycine zipper family protein [Desulfopila sp.]|nr:glycine zipper family protein [Desulfopila sp.]
MKRSAIAITLITFLTLCSSQVFAGEKEIYGALIGAGSGAVIGHAIGGDVESVIIGSAIGGALGITVTNIKKHGYPGHHPRYIIHPPNYKSDYKRYHKKPRYYDRHYSKDRNCRIVKYTSYEHGRKYYTTKRICYDDRYFRGKHHDRRDRYHDRDRLYRY